MHNGTAQRQPNLTRLLELLWDVLREQGTLTLTAAGLPADKFAEIEFDTKTVAFCPELTLDQFAEAIAHELTHAERGPCYVDEVEAEEAIVEEQAMQLLYGPDALTTKPARSRLTVLQGGAR